MVGRGGINDRADVCLPGPGGLLLYPSFVRRSSWPELSRMCKVVRGGGDLLGVDIMTGVELAVCGADRQDYCYREWRERAEGECEER